MTQLVKLEPYNKEWENMFNVDKILISDVLKGKFSQIEHIGSTAIPGMWAKPLIDIAVAVEDLSLVDDDAIEKLASIGYEYVPKEYFPKRKFFRRGEWGAGTHHLHIYEIDSYEWQNIILFRNYLRLHKEVAQEYIELKKQLASKHERVNYTNLKAPFIQKVIYAARNEYLK
ncbi:GrpB family protein [Bacillus mycoides]|uniref:GrpB family protein n=1 Tax=Bacillus mycoides TaxID=1405 RepID=A0A1S9T0X5_BACMY|nr:GrpB family protein [Bacillus mycoides]OOR03663.1 hypothetical protein BW900_25865 [Bacillus mycoides]